MRYRLKTHFNCMRKVFSSSILTFIIIFTSCKHAPQLEYAPVVSFKNDIQPIFSGNCMQSGCHGSGSDAGEFPLSTYDDVKDRVNAGDATGSSIYKAVTGRGERMMPPDSPLPDNEIEQIYLWIEEGALDN